MKTAPHFNVAGAAAHDEAVELRQIVLDPNIVDQTLIWGSGAENVFSVSVFLNGMSIGEHGPVSVGNTQDTSNHGAVNVHSTAFHLRLPEAKEHALPRGSYEIHRSDVVETLRHTLRRLENDGRLARSVFYFGVTSDPLLPFAPKFECARACIELFHEFPPSLLVLQTRSPGILHCVSTLQKMSSRVVVALSIESHLESSVRRYTPGLPPVRDRFEAARELRAEGIKVNLVASPVLPYGDYYKDAWDFAGLLVKHSDFVTVGSLAVGEISEDQKLSTFPLARKLAADGQRRWLRPNMHRFLAYAVYTLDSSKLTLPVGPQRKASQLSIFAAQRQ